MKAYPALDVRSDSADLIQAIVDDFEPTAIEERDGAIRVFFASSAARDSAGVALASRFDVMAIDLPDDDWARRSQQNLAPVTVGRITIYPSPKSPPTNPDSHPTNPESQITNPISLVIQPSMGFGTGHHATTRLCVDALQTIDLAGAVVLDVGTGSGVLALAAARLGAARALGIDTDAEAIQSARENVPLNPDIRHVAFEIADLMSASLAAADVVTANLTGALLIRAAERLGHCVRPGGTLIVSGLLAAERDDTVAAFGGLTLKWEHEEDGWIGLVFKGPRSSVRSARL